MKEYTLKIVGNKALITSIEEPWISTKFNDLHAMVHHCNNHKIRITNPEVLPAAFQKQLNH